MPFSTSGSFWCSVAANVTRCLVETILAMSSDATRLQKLRLKKRECRDETQKRDGCKYRRVRLSIGCGLVERSIRAHNLLEYRDRE